MVSVGRAKSCIRRGKKRREGEWKVEGKKEKGGARKGELELAHERDGARRFVFILILVGIGSDI